MTKPTEAQKALQRLADKCWNSQSYEGDSSIGKDVTIIEQALRTASAQQGVAAHNTRANLDAKKLREVEDALCDIGQIIDVVRIEWQDENSWSDWDENARKKLSKSLTILDALIKDVEEK